MLLRNTNIQMFVHLIANLFKCYNPISALNDRSYYLHIYMWGQNKFFQLGIQLENYAVLPKSISLALNLASSSSNAALMSRRISRSR